ncbi:MAG: UDP-N-acetylmuramate dehydrogenase [Sporichthyaceae bacterium]
MSGTELTAAPLAQRTTLRLGGPASRLVVVHSEADLVDAVRTADAAGDPVLVLGRGSNVVIADEGFDGLVVQIATRGVQRSAGDLTIAAGEDWDDVVALAVEDGLAGIEALSGIPGLVGATPIQNVGAYGQEVAQTVTAVRVLERTTRQVVTMAPADCRFSYRHSRFKGNDEYVVLSVAFGLEPSATSRPVRYAELARRLGVAVGASAPLTEVRQAVLDLRRAKGMVLDPGDYDTWSAGSFFTNPVLTRDDADRLLPSEVPHWDEPDGRLKVSAAWLIEHAGFGKGYRGTDGTAVQVSSKHSLALTNRGSASTADLLTLAREIRDGVRDRFGIELTAEPVLVGCSL